MLTDETSALMQKPFGELKKKCKDDWDVGMLVCSRLRGGSSHRRNEMALLAHSSLNVSLILSQRNLFSLKMSKYLPLTSLNLEILWWMFDAIKPKEVKNLVDSKSPSAEPTHLRSEWPTTKILVFNYILYTFYLHVLGSKYVFRVLYTARYVVLNRLFVLPIKSHILR